MNNEFITGARTLGKVIYEGISLRRVGEFIV